MRNPHGDERNTKKEKRMPHERNIGNNKLMKERSFFKIFRGRFKKKRVEEETNEGKSEQRKQETKKSAPTG